MEAVRIRPIGPRIAQYITMTPAKEDDQAHRESRIEGWRDRLTGLGKNRKEKEHFEGENGEAHGARANAPGPGSLGSP